MPSNRLSALVASWFPEFVRERGPNLVAFFEAWVEWMEEERGIVTAHIKALDRKDIDTTLDEYVDFFHAEFMTSIPANVLADRRLLIKHIQKFYRAKGSQKSLRFLFRILFDEEIDFYYPARDILRCSGAKWVIDRTMTVVPYVTDAAFGDLLGHVITGSVTGAQARVESIRTEIQSLSPVQVVLLSNVTKVFQADESITYNGTNYGRLTAYTVHPGRFDNTDGFLSSNKYLQGPHYYQEFSYVIKSSQSVKFYADIVKQLVHPAGVKMFGEVAAQLVTNELTIEVSDTGTDLVFEPVSIEMAPVVETTLGFTDTSAASLFYYLLVENDDLAHQVTYNRRLVSATGTLDTANIDLTDIVNLLPYAGWSFENFSDGKGLIGTGTNLVDVVRVNDVLLLTGGLKIDLSPASDITAVAVSVDSQTTMRIAPAHPDHPVTGLALSVYTYFPTSIRTRDRYDVVSRDGTTIIGRGLA